MRAETKTEPIDPSQYQTNARLTIAPTYKDPQTGALYVHQDLVRVQDPWAEEEHIGPMRASEQFGDVESFVAYIARYGTLASFLTWNKAGLRAVLDYAADEETPGRGKWTAMYPFAPSHQWRAWTGLAGGQPVGQKGAVEKLDDLAEDIIEPAPVDLTNLLRSLRATVNTKAETELRPDGSSSVIFAQDTTVKGKGGALDLPPAITIAIPVLKGHLDDGGRPVLYRLQVRLRVSTDNDARLALRFSIPNAERVLEVVYADRVKLASELLGEDYALLRAAD